MDNFKNIQDKLHDFIRKYYTNEIIKGSILFLSFGLLYFIFTLFVEYFLWLRPVARTFLFWIFLLVEFGLLLKFILFPLFKLIGIQKGISAETASKIIGKHFKEIDDKLLNLIQLNSSKTSSDLLLASIEQKSFELQPIRFKQAINFRVNIGYLRFLAIPLAIWAVFFLSGNNSIFSDSFNRVVHYKTVYLPPAPFEFQILNEDLVAIEDIPFVLEVSTAGNIQPEDIKIIFNGETYYLHNKNSSEFFFEFEQPNHSFQFYLEANEVRSRKYKIEVIKTPKIINFEMGLTYPDYLIKADENIENTGNAVVPEGTKVVWNISTENTVNVDFSTTEDIKRNNNAPIESLAYGQDGNYSLTKIIGNSIDYKIATSNDNLNNYEVLSYRLSVIKDQYPVIIVRSDIDSVSRGPVNFAGQLRDDYGISHLQVIAKSLKDNSMSIYNIDIGRSDFEEFFYTFPEGISLEEGVSYEIFFQVFDNDGVNGSKRSKSQVFYYKSKTDREIEEELIMEQKENIESMHKASRNYKEFQKDLLKFSDKLKSKNKSDWNDDKKLNDFIERQKAYQKIMDKNRENVLRNLEEIERSPDEEVNEKQKELIKRIEESKELQKKEEMLKELQELTEKLKKENLLDRAKKLQDQTKQQERSLERILELTKQFYVERKALQIINNLSELAKEQNELAKKDRNNLAEQDALNKKFDSIRKELEELRKQNEELKTPMGLPETTEDEKRIKDQMQKAKSSMDLNEKELQKKSGDKNENTKKSQKSAAKELKELSKKMSAQMEQMQMEGSEENIRDLQQILDNLLIFSFDQESLMITMKGITSGNAEYPDKLKHQQTLKEYFEHIDDSLFTLSMRVVQLSAKIDKYVNDAHYNLDKSLEAIAENKIENGVTHQRYTMTAANQLADMLSNVLNNLKNKKPGSGSGKGKNGESIELPDIIQKQKQLIEKMKEGIEPGKSNEGKSKEQMSGEQFQIYQEQKELRDRLKELLEKGRTNGKNEQNVLDQMEEIEKLLLEKGLTKEGLKKMEELNHELMKLDKANYTQNKEEDRKANSGFNMRNTRVIDSIKSNKTYFNRNEILLRHTLPLQQNYQEKVKVYFNNN